MSISRILDTIDTSTIMVTLSSDNLFRNHDRSLSLTCGTFFPNRPTGILSAE